MSTATTCVICHQPESTERPGNFYDARATNGMELVHFWVCNACAFKLGPRQGFKDPY